MNARTQQRRPRHAVLFELLRQENVSARMSDRQKWRARIDRRETSFADVREQAERSWRRPPVSSPVA